MKENKNKGLYNPDFEHDACGIAFVADIKNRKSRNIIDLALKAQENLDHRGAVGADPETGDGAGILFQMPDKFFRRVFSEIDIELPEYGKYGIGFMFLPQDSVTRKAVENIVEKIIVDEGQNFLGWRDVPVNNKVPGKGAKFLVPFIRQCVIGASSDMKTQLDFERRLYLIRRVIDQRIRLELKLDRKNYYVPSFSSRTIVYKGMLLAYQLAKFYPDLKDKDIESSLAMVHTRFSTNTLPSWELAHPYRYIVHNGEINTVRGNKNWMATRQAVMNSPHFGRDLKRMLPIIMEGQSDSATFDSVLELLVMGGRSLPHAMMMMIPEAWSKNDLMDPELRA
ncbi:MAG: glutamate synthase subunit alpha, partial [Spirochaetia bacterium]|nr:glutamate synthase subunit alpha [Spirochaetia bacterium]